MRLIGNKDKLYFYKKFLYSPLEQFENFPIFDFSGVRFLKYIPESFDITFTNFSLFTLICLFVFVFWSYSALRFSYVVPSRLQLLFEQFYQFLYAVLTQQAGLRGGIFFPFLVTTFITIFLANFLGLIPYSYTLTSSLFIPFSLALAFNLGFVIWGFYLHGWSFLSLFVPKGVPAFLLPLLILIELMSYLIRSFSLSLRLFANMMAGHALLQILASFVQVFLLSFSLLSVLALVPFFLVLFVFVLELGIAFLQAYVFVILLSIYFNDSLNLH